MKPTNTKRAFGAWSAGVLLGLGLLFASPAQAAGEAGTVLNLSGTLSAKSADGALRVLAVKSAVMSGDTLYTGKGSYARIKFGDGGEITLRPETHFAIENFHFNAAEPKKDSAMLGLLKGGLRAVSGLVGKRGDPDSYAMKTATATIGIRGTEYGAQYCQGDCGNIPNGLHVDVGQGQVIVQNQAGSQLFNAGQFGYVADSKTPPVVVPREQGVKVNVPASTSSDPGKSGSNGKGQADDNCVVK